MSEFKTRLEAKSREAATVRYVDEERQKSFKAGARWVAEYLVTQLTHDAGVHGVPQKGYPKEMIEGFMLNDMRSVLSGLLEEDKA